MKKLHAILFFVLFISGIQLKAQDFKFYVNSIDTAYLNESFKVVFVIENARQVSNFRPPQFSGFTVTSEQQGSSSVNINGKISQSYYLTYFLQAKKEGKFTINEASVQINGVIEKTQPFNVFIKPAKEKTIPQNNNQERNVNADNNFDKDIFIRLSTNNNQPYVGEAITLNAKVYFKINIRDLQPLKLPEFKNFWSEETTFNQQERKVETFNGTKYYTVDLYKYTLIPLKEGKLTIDPFEFNSVIEAQILRNHPFWGQYYDVEIMNHKVACNNLIINTKALPQADKPENFNGAVGSFKLSTSIDKDTVEYGQAINLTAKISGTGNFSMFDVPTINFPNHFEIYDPEVVENVNSINGSKTFNYILVPQTPGKYKISPISFSYFDVQQKKYRTLTSDSIIFNIGGELPEEIITESDIDSIPENEIYTIVSKANLHKTKNVFYGSMQYYTALASPIFLFVFIFLAKRYRDNSLIDLVALKRNRASKEAQKRLKKANEFLKQVNKEAFYTEIFDALNGYVGDKLNITQADLSKELISENFAKKNVSLHLVSQFTQVLSNAEAALYSPASVNKMQEDYDIAINWIVEIEHEIT